MILSKKSSLTVSFRTLSSAAMISLLALCCAAAGAAPKPGPKAAGAAAHAKAAAPAKPAASEPKSAPAASEAGDEKEPPKVDFASLPEPVRNAAKKELGTDQGLKAYKVTEQGVTSYDIAPDKEEPEQTVEVSEQGDVISSSKTIQATQVPVPVQAALKKKFPKQNFEAVEMVTTHFYVAHSGGEHGTDVQVDPAGNISEDEEGPGEGPGPGGKGKR